jgi:hypothetical protein
MVQEKTDNSMYLDPGSQSHIYRSKAAAGLNGEAGGCQISTE